MLWGLSVLSSFLLPPLLPSLSSSFPRSFLSWCRQDSSVIRVTWHHQTRKSEFLISPHKKIQAKFKSWFLGCNINPGEKDSRFLWSILRKGNPSSCDVIKGMCGEKLELWRQRTVPSTCTQGETVTKDRSEVDRICFSQWHQFLSPRWNRSTDLNRKQLTPRKNLRRDHWFVFL